MLKWLSTFAVLGFSITARAAVLDKPQDILDAVNAGRHGAWLDTSALKKCAAGLEDAKSYKLQLEDSEKQVQLFRDNAILLEEARQDADKRSGLWEAQAEDQKSKSESYARELEAWYRNPFILIGGGLLLGAAITATAIAVSN